MLREDSGKEGCLTGGRGVLQGCGGRSTDWSCSWSKEEARLSSEAVFRCTPLEKDSLDLSFDFSTSEISGHCKGKEETRL